MTFSRKRDLPLKLEWRPLYDAFTEAVVRKRSSPVISKTASAYALSLSLSLSLSVPLPHLFTFRRLAAILFTTSADSHAVPTRRAG
jgi:hypothetical protein